MRTTMSKPVLLEFVIFFLILFASFKNIIASTKVDSNDDKNQGIAQPVSQTPKNDIDVNLIEKIHILWEGRRNQEKRWRQVDQEMDSLRAENQNQALKIRQLEEKLTKLHTISHMKPPENHQSRKNNNNKIPAQMPSNCQNLLTIGHSLSGFYLVKDRTHNKIATIFCDFQSSFVEKRIGFVNFKSLPNGVHFYFQRKNELDKPDNIIIPYEKELLNEGGAMNMIKGIFTAPVPGIYHFQFQGEKKNSNSNEALNIFLRLNGQVIGNAYAATDPGKYKSCTVQTTLKLKRGDQVDLFKLRGTLHDDSTPDTHFTGMLLEEDLTTL